LMRLAAGADREAQERIVSIACVVAAEGFRSRSHSISIDE
jgi:hypothetical protein